MPRVRLTDVTIEKLPSSKVRVTYWDETLPAFGVRVGARRKTFIVVVNGGHRIKLGNYPFKSLKDARREAHLRLGNPGGDGLVVADAAPAGEVVKKFIDIHHAQSRPRTRDEQERFAHHPTGPRERSVMETRSSPIHRKMGRNHHSSSPLLDLPIRQLL
jgi:hypothetical protein